MALTIDDLLNSLQSGAGATLDNTKETWRRIGNKDRFSELGLSGSDLDDFLKDWVEDNPYSLI